MSCALVGLAYMPLEEALFSLNLHPTHEFTWGQEIIGDKFYDLDAI